MSWLRKGSNWEEIRKPIFWLLVIITLIAIGVVFGGMIVKTAKNLIHALF